MDEGWAATQTGMRDMKLATTTELSAETCVTIPPVSLRSTTSLKVNWPQAKRGRPGPLHKGALKRVQMRYLWTEL